MCVTGSNCDCLPYEFGMPLPELHSPGVPGYKNIGNYDYINRYYRKYQFDLAAATCQYYDFNTNRINPDFMDKGISIKLAGIDIGSRSIEFVLLDGETRQVMDRFRSETSINLSAQLSLINWPPFELSVLFAELRKNICHGFACSGSEKHACPSPAMYFVHIILETAFLPQGGV